MGSHENISATRFPRQGTNLHKRVEVCFHFDSSQRVQGTVVREDVQSPFVMLIRLDDDRYVEAGECQYRTLDEDDPPPAAASAEPVRYQDRS